MAWGCAENGGIVTRNARKTNMTKVMGVFLVRCICLAIKGASGGLWADWGHFYGMGFMIEDKGHLKG